MAWPKLRIPKVWVSAMCVLGCLGLWGFAGIKQESRHCEQILVRIMNDGGNQFLSASELRKEANMVNGHEFWLIGRPWHEINLAEVERHISKLDFVDRSRAWKDHSGILHLDVWQMEPFVRLMTYGNRDRYLDTKGFNYPVSESFTARVMIADGPGVNVLLEKVALQGDFTDKRNPKAKVDPEAEALFNLLLKINTDHFLKPLIAQVTVSDNGEVTMYPQVGNQVIYFGKPEGVDNKVRKLQAFYEQIVAARSWDKYRSVNLKFENQIICEQ